MTKSGPYQSTARYCLLSRLLAIGRWPLAECREIREFSEVSDFAIFPNLLKFSILRSLLLLGNKE
jgi:hypothetical protein